MQIEYKISLLHFLHVLRGQQSETQRGTIKEFESIRQELLSMQSKVVNGSYFRKSLLAPEILENLNEIASRLAREDDTFNLVGMVGACNVGHPQTVLRFLMRSNRWVPV